MTYRVCAAVLGGLSLVVAGCGSDAPARIDAPKISASGAADAAIAAYDENKDGTIAGPELDKAASLKSGLKYIDKNNDGKITKDEIQARIEGQQALRLGAKQVIVSVTLDGQPLPDARVTFVPEAWIGGELKKATGVTDKDGRVSVFAEADRGPAPGYYKVEVTKEGAGIPDRFNKATILGQEVANETGNDGEVKFALTRQ